MRTASLIKYYVEVGEEATPKKAGEIAEWVLTILYNDDASTDEEMVNHFVKEGPLSPEIAETLVGLRDAALRGDDVDNEVYDIISEGPREAMDVPTKHQMKIAKHTLRMSDAGAHIAGGMTKPEARAFLKKQGWSDQKIKNYEQAEDQQEQEGDPDADSVREAVSDLCHRQWSNWMEHMFSKSTHNEDGTVTIPAELVERWEKQMTTDYEDLTEEEQDSDRTEADKFLQLINAEDAEA